MSNYIEATNLLATQFVTPTSRYAGSTVYYYGEDRKLTFGTYTKSSVPTSDQDRFMIITPGVEYRPDLVSYDLFGTCDFWWRIMEANNMIDILDFTAGTMITIPNSLLV